jgi:hypothetical protein
MLPTIEFSEKAGKSSGEVPKFDFAEYSAQILRGNRSECEYL